MPPINFPDDLAPGPSQNDTSITRAILNVAVLLAFVLITGYALRATHQVGPNQSMLGKFRKSSSAPPTPNQNPDNRATTSGAQKIVSTGDNEVRTSEATNDVPADEPIEQWDMVGDDWGIIPDSAEVRKERREEERLTRSTASLVGDTGDAAQGADAEPAPSPSPALSPENPILDQGTTASLPAPSLAAAQEDLLRSADEYHADPFSGLHYGDRHEYTHWNFQPRTPLSSTMPALGYGTATRVGLGVGIAPMGIIETITAQSGGRWPDMASLPPPPHLGEQSTLTELPTPPPQPNADLIALSADPPVPSVAETIDPEDYVPIDLQDADPRAHNETLETHIRLLQTENVSQRQVIETLRQELESTRRAQRNHLGGPASQPVSTVLAPAETVVAQAPPMHSAVPELEHASARGVGEGPPIPPVPTMAFNEESVDLTQHLDNVRVHIQALERHVQLSQTTLLQRIDRLERSLSWREDIEVGKLMAKIEREEEDAERNMTGKWFEGTGLWTRPATHAVPRAPTQRADIRTATDATHYRTPSSAESSGRQTPPSSTPSFQDADSQPNQCLELTQPHSYPLDPRIADQTSNSGYPDGRQTLITDYFRPQKAVSPESCAAALIQMELDPQDYDDLYAPASPRSHATDLDLPHEDLTDYTELYQAVSPRAGDPVLNERWTFNAMAASFHPDAAAHHLQSQALSEPGEWLGEPSPSQLDVSPATGQTSQPQLSSRGELKAGLAEAARAVSIPAEYLNGRNSGRPEAPRTLPAFIGGEPSPLSLDAIAASCAQISVAPQSAPVPVLDPCRQSIPASVRTASLSQRVSIIPSDTQERRQRRKRRKNAAACAQ
ncbi:hypothetical protein B0A48_00539 [Cryoendolithus antarcticus]|uniref:Uncharacterized protein n=1 Tax=Cryoendolithus antarcticus TaxID=1507870 RepID=A0A1V8TUZ1_9PEZI|nr:hypothetical protein B0A48_00539 [Cryoendolithus antarcticus]